MALNLAAFQRELAVAHSEYVEYLTEIHNKYHDRIFKARELFVEDQDETKPMKNPDVPRGGY